MQSPTSSEQDEQSRQNFVNEQLDGLETRITETQEEIAQKQQELAGVFSARQIADLQSQIGALQAKLTSLQTNYTNLLSNTEQGAINTLTVIETAALPRIPVGSRTATTVMVAAAIGFVLAAGAAFILEYLDDSVKSPEDVTRITGLPTLAGIARIREDDDGGKLVALSHPRSPTTEAYRVLRTGIQFSSVDNPNQVRLMVTSPSPSEGKSLTVANLSIVMAQAGNNVLIIDADLRRPVQNKLFRLPQKGGLTTLLLEADLDPNSDQTLSVLKQVIQQTSVEGLHILSSGPIPPNPSEMLGSTKMAAALETLDEHYDYIIIDSPPILAVTDATVLSRQSDGVLLVTDASRTRSAQLKQATEQLMSGNAHVIGVVLNRLTPRSDGYYSYYYYRHSYYLEEPEEPEEEDESAPPTNGKGSRLWRRGKTKKTA
jgi:non-specific protein-tyrosine kinase